MPPACDRSGGAVLNKRDAVATDRRDGTAAILFGPLAAAEFELEHIEANGAFAGTVAQYWSAHWDRPDHDPYLARLLPAPCVNVTFSPGRSRVTGVTPAMFTERLEGRGTVFGVRFRPGAFRALLGRPVASITGRFLPVTDVFGAAAAEWEEPVLAAAEVSERAAVFETLFGASRVPAPSDSALLARHAVEAIVADRTLLRVGDLAARHGMDVRRIERLFAEYVGVSPKWTIRRYRMQEAAARAGAAQFEGWTRLAHDLGYADQAHFGRDFRANTGLSPSDYRRRTGDPGGGTPR